MRIAFDGTSLRSGRSGRAGAATYTEQLLRHLVDEGPTHDVIVLSNRPVTVTQRLRYPVRVVGSGLRLPRSLWLQTAAPWLVWRCRPDVTHFTAGRMPWVRVGPTVVTVRDLGLLRRPAIHSPRRPWFERPFLEMALREADALIVPFQSVRADIARHCPAALGRVHVVAPAAAAEFRPVRDIGWLESVRRRYALGDRVILFVGTIDHRKNLPLLLEAFAQRVRNGDLTHQLACVGPYGWGSRDIEETIERLGIESRVRFTGGVPVADLPALYNLADMLVHPASDGGGGLTVLEAMACGTPVIVGQASALAEVGGAAVVRVGDGDADSLGAAMARLARSREQRVRFAALGEQRAATFTWTRAARETLAVYERAWRGAAGVLDRPDVAPLGRGSARG